jgi:hypothetical protein
MSLGHSFRHSFTSQSGHCTKALWKFPTLLLSGILALPLLTAAAASPTGAQETVTFKKRITQPGETSQQELTCDLDLVMSIRQSGQVVQSQQQLLKRQQQRELKILKASAGVPQQASIRYLRSSISIKAAEQAEQGTEQPVTGKTYLVSRKGGELQITYPDGNEPSPEELAIVRDNMDTFGLPNPIAEFFDGKRVRLGQQLDLPAPLARELLGFADTANSASKFRMQLQEIMPPKQGQLRAARFAIEMEAADPEQSGVSMKLAGELLMEIDTCRSLAVQLTGPVSASETHGPEAATYEVYTEGDIKVAVRTQNVR